MAGLQRDSRQNQYRAKFLVLPTIVVKGPFRVIVNCAHVYRVQFDPS